MRVGGTLGWIAAAWPFVFLPITNLFTIAGIAALVTAAYCLVLPSTPLPAKHEGSAFAPSARRRSSSSRSPQFSCCSS